MTSYENDYQQSLQDPETFWSKAAEGISWSKPWDRVLNSENPPFYRWFEGAEMNTCYNCLDRHVEEGRGDQDALIYDSPMTGQVVKFTYREFTDIVARFAGALASRGITKGDRVLIYMPMVPEAAVAMLACARIGAIHSVVFGGFAPKELATRIDDAKPVAIIAASCGLEPGRTIAYKPLIDDAINLSSHKPSSCIILQRPECEAELSSERDCDWQALVAASEPAPCVPVAATDPLYILYTSGTTGIPKGVVRDNGGHAVALRWSMKYVYDINPGEVFWAASDVGWVVGHSYIVYAPLLHGCTTILYEGKPVGTPDAGAFWRVIQDHKVKALFTAPTAFRAIRQQDPEGKLIPDYDLSNFVTLFLAGERADPDTIIWAQDQLKVPVIDHWWQTETGWAIGANCMGYGMKPVKLGSPTLPVPGYDIRIIDERDSKTEMARGDIGVIAVKLPLPPGSLPTLWQNDEGFVRSYMADIPGYYKTGDAGYIDEDGYLFIMARTDDIINVAGHRLSTGGMEEVLAGHPDVAESAVMGVQDKLKGQVPVGFVVVNAGVNRPEEEIQKELVALVREKIGPVAAFKIVLLVKRLPKTRSGKILRAVMRKIADGEPYNAPATIDDPEVLTEITEVLANAGYPAK
ncbi:propionyl-CoA synthetase [uncultured Sneathiella sp.]|jgi:propionyl-CoA synthetase|uniref:propionyl-CoA synthetase n=1 Tax=uncultured Sneathiella sp. TaxID=879315 RepID=UPI0030D99FAC|tara:strand:- start:93971 stop:95872 length:1902 start_codon:yes stop_codon:yes gene_type:complete